MNGEDYGNDCDYCGDPGAEDCCQARIDLASLRVRFERTELDRDALWVLLDDIDTASDMFKSNYEGLAKHVFRKQQLRHLVTPGGRIDVPAAQDHLNSLKRGATFEDGAINSATTTGDNKSTGSEAS